MTMVRVVALGINRIQPIPDWLNNTDSTIVIYRNCPFVKSFFREIAI